MTVLVDQATELVRSKPEFRRAVLRSATGTPDHDEATEASDITRWRFVFNNPTASSRDRSASVEYENGRFGAVTGIAAPFVGSTDIGRPEMTLSTAVSKLRAAGFDGPLSEVGLSQPVVPGVSEPLYVFTLTSGPGVSVGTKTGTVKETF